MAGVAGVKVAPEARGGGVGRALTDGAAGRDRGPRLPAVRAVPGHRAAVPVVRLRDRRRPVPGHAAGPVAARAAAAGGRDRAARTARHALRRAGPGRRGGDQRGHRAGATRPPRACGPVSYDLATSARADRRRGPVLLPRRRRVRLLRLVRPHARSPCTSPSPARRPPRRAVWSLLASHGSMAADRPRHRGPGRPDRLADRRARRPAAPHRTVDAAGDQCPGGDRGPRLPGRPAGVGPAHAGRSPGSRPTPGPGG